jgi:cobalt-zinc-cadmium efflux system membrane fusion protein
MYARVTLVADDKVKAVRLPNASFVTDGLNSYVFVETEPGVFSKRRVTFSVQDREFGYLASGVKPGERVVTTGALLLNAELAIGS